MLGLNVILGLNIVLFFLVSKRVGRAVLVLISAVSFSTFAVADCYNYDTLGRLDKVVYDTDGTVADYNLDQHGNRVSVSTVVSSSNCDVPSRVTSLEAGAPLALEDTGYVPHTSPLANQSPVANDLFFSMLPETEIRILPTFGSIDPDGDFLSLVSVNTSFAFESMVQTVNGLGHDLVVLRSGQATGVGVIDFVVEDAHGATAHGKITVSVNSTAGANSPDAALETQSVIDRTCEGLADDPIKQFGGANGGATGC